MRRVLALAVLLCAAAPVRADVAEVVTLHILPGHARFAEAAEALAQRADETCATSDLEPAYHAAFDAWMAVQHLHIGPVEEDGRGLAIAYWPDRPWQADTCPLIRATARDLARLAAEVQAGWTGGFADLMLTAGAPGNTRFLSQAEARQALFTLIVTGLEQLHNQRLGRPLGSFDRPTPERAEARASGRSLRNVTLALQALRDMARQLAPSATRTLAAFDHAITLAEALPDPILSGIASPEGWLKVEILQQAVGQVTTVAQEELGAALGV